jgi:hypothetical protein
MGQKPPKAVLSRVRKLAQIARDLSEGADFSITRLTSLKSLCEDPEVAAHFAVYLAKHTSRRINEMSSPLHLSNSEWRMHNEILERAVERLQSYVERPADPKREELRELLRELESVNDEYESIPYGMVRIIRDKNVLIVEHARRACGAMRLVTILCPEPGIPSGKGLCRAIRSAVWDWSDSGLGATCHGHRGFLVRLLFHRPG